MMMSTFLEYDTIVYKFEIKYSISIGVIYVSQVLPLLGTEPLIKTQHCITCTLHVQCSLAIRFALLKKSKKS